MSDPTSGKMMNAQSWPRAFGSVSAKSAVARLRAGLTLVLSTGIVTRWMAANVMPATTPPNPGANLRLVVDSTTITNSAVKTISTMIAAPSPLKPSRSHPLEANPPRSQPSRPLAIPKMTAAPKIPPAICADPRPERMAQRDLVRQQQPERDRRVDVASADRADHVRHEQQGEAERRRDAERADRLAGEDRAPRSEHDQHGGAHELGGDDRLVGRDHAPGVGDRLTRRHGRRVLRRRRHGDRGIRRRRERNARLHEGGPYPTASVRLWLVSAPSA